MAENDTDVAEALDGIDPEKRKILAGLVGTPFVAPVVSSFAMLGLSLSTAAEAASSVLPPNQTKHK